MAGKPPKELIMLCSRLARLTKRRYRSPHKMKVAHAYLRFYAEANDLPEEWCDAVFQLFLDDLPNGAY